MIKILSLVAFLSVSVFAQSFWFTNEKKAGEYAYENKIPIIIVKYSDHCPWCQRVLTSFKNGKLKNVLNSGKIVFLGIKSTDPRITKYNLTSNKIPAFFFVDPNGRKIAQPIDGYLDPIELDDFFKKYYTWYEKDYVSYLYNKMK